MAASKLSQQRACTVYSTDPCYMLRGQAIDFIFLVWFCKVRTQRGERNYPGQNLSTFLLMAPFTPCTPFFNDEVFREIRSVLLGFASSWFQTSSLNEGVKGVSVWVPSFVPCWMHSLVFDLLLRMQSGLITQLTALPDNAG